MKPALLCLLSILCIHSQVTNADIADHSGGVVEALQMPAWYDRNGQRHPLSPGAKLFSGDTIRTGSNARVRIRLNEGSLVKLGESAQLNITSLRPPAKKESIFAALLRVSRGAFRFTTTRLGKSYQRKVDIKIGSITAGIRGTDIWGRSNNEKDLLCLIEGSINAQHEGEKPFAMSKPLSYFTAAEGELAQPVITVDSKTLASWAEETEPQPGQGVLTIDGRWAVNLMSLQNPQTASDLQQQLNTAGFATELQRIQLQGTGWTRLRIEGFATRQDALSFASDIDSQYGISAPWVIESD